MGAGMRPYWFGVFALCCACTPRLYTEAASGAPWSPPTNSWPVQAPPDTLQASGFGVGQVPPDLRLVDQHGDDVSLWQFYGLVVLLDISTMWCAPCQELAQGTAHTFDDYRDDGFMYLTVLQEDVESHPPDRDDLVLWANTFAIESPVLADGRDPATGTLPRTAAAVQRGQFPALLLINRDLTISRRVNPSTDEAARVLIEAAL